MNQATPLAVDGYSRFMARKFDEKDIIGVPTGFQSLFGRPSTGAVTVYAPDAKLVEIDIQRGNERIAALIHRGSNSRPLTGQSNISEQRYSSFSRRYPLIEEEGDINADQILNRLAGESPYSNSTRLDRMRDLGLTIHKESQRRIIRLCEVLAAQSALEGVQDAIFDTSNTDLQYDFHRLATHTVTPAAKWDVITTDIIGDIDTGCNLVRANGKVQPDCLIMGGGAMAAFLANTTVKELADNRRIELIQVSLNNPVPANLAFMVESGFNARGLLRTAEGYELWMFTYVDGYTNAAGTFTKYMPTEQALLFASEARCDRYFGPPELLPNTPLKMQFFQEMFGFSPQLGMRPPNIKAASGVVQPEMFYFDAYTAANHKTVTVRTQAAPIYATTMTDAFLTFIAVLT